MKILSAIISLILLLSHTVIADDKGDENKVIPAFDSKITKVTIHRNGGATVTRQTLSPVPKGTEAFIIRGLPVGTQAPVIIGANETMGPLKITSTSQRTRYLSKAAREQLAKIEAELKKAKEEERRLTGVSLAEDFTADYLKSFSKREAEPNANTLKFIQNEAKKHMARTMAIETQYKDAEEEIKRLERELKALGPDASAIADFKITLAETTKDNSLIVVHYFVENAYWRESSDAYLNTKEAKINLAIYAQINQTTGEDWSNIQVTLDGSQASSNSPQFGLSSEFFDLTIANVSALRAYPMAEAKSEVRSKASNNFSYHYQLQETLNIPSSGKPQKALIANMELYGTVIARSVKDSASALYIDIDVPKGYALSAGIVSLNRDGVRLGNTSWPAIRAGERVRLPFGTLPYFGVTRTKLGGQDKDRGLFGNSREHVNRWRYDIRNGYDIPLEFEILDQMPVSTDKELKIEATNNALTPTEDAFEGKPGVYLWRRKLSPLETWTFEHGYKMRFPAKMEPSRDYDMQPR